MNLTQQLWIAQTRSDYQVFKLLLNSEVDDCQKLHYLQMVTEKLSKAYFAGRSNVALITHKAFRKFINDFGIGWDAKKKKAFAEQLEFRDFKSLEKWLDLSDDLINEIERLAPSLNIDGPNPEYPWPRNSPQFSPTTYPFPLWVKLQHPRGQKFFAFLDLLILSLHQL